MMKMIVLILGIFVALHNPVFADDTSQNQNFEGFNLQGYGENGEKNWDVKGDTADIEGTQINLSNVVANSYGKEKLNVTAESGSVDQVNGSMQLKKDVVVTSESGAQLVTDSLNWDKQRDLVSTKDGVIITHDGLTVTGTGMEANPGLKSGQIQENVTARINPEAYNTNAKTITITSDGPMTMDEGKSMASFEKNVVAVQLDRMLKADKMEIFFDTETNTIKEMVCTGNVEITQGENKTYAEKAVYKASEKRVILSGRPKLIMLTEGNNVFSTLGDKKSGQGL